MEEQTKWTARVRYWTDGLVIGSRLFVHELAAAVRPRILSWEWPEHPAPVGLAVVHGPKAIPPPTRPSSPIAASTPPAEQTQCRRIKTMPIRHKKCLACA
ncbi:MAG: hypothetical protein RBU25_03225 [Lentisphaeria bacterium]|jgi:hypothetical protein|nr:hypothetical protein [Lentisphaeria bacterium]